MTFRTLTNELKAPAGALLAAIVELFIGAVCLLTLLRVRRLNPHR